MRTAHENNQKRSGIIHSPKHSFRWLRVFSGIFFFLSIIGYLFSVNRNAVAGYSLRTVEKRITELSSEAQKLRIQEAQLRSFYGIEELSERLGMIPLRDVTVIDEYDPVAYR